MDARCSVVVIDGADGAGKTTQVALLKERFKVIDFINHNFMKFPNYDSTTGYFITKYLEGKFEPVFEGLDPLDKINKISMLYAMDRVVWFANYYDPHVPLICDRYTTSNILHMGALIIHSGGTIDDVYAYIDNLEDLEYNKLNIPAPDLVIYLDVPTTQLTKNLQSTDKVLDIHEDERIFKQIESVKKAIIEYCGWTVVNCTDEHGMRSIDDINNDIIDIIRRYYNM